MGLLDFFGIRKKAVGSFALAVMNRFTGTTGNAENFLRSYSNSVYVYSCVKKRSEKVGQINFVLFNRNTGKEIEEDPILNLLAKPNQFQTGAEFFELYQNYKDLTGSVYVYMLRKTPGKGLPLELHLLRPDWITEKVVNEATGLIGKYKYRPQGGKLIEIDADDILFSHHPNPLDPTTGLSPLQAGMMAVDTERQLSIYQNTVLKNGGKVEGIINFKSETLTEEQVQEIRDSFHKQYAGTENAGKPIVLGGEAEYQNLGLNPTELSYIESKKMTRDDICMIYGVPKAIVAQSDDVNYANAKMAREIFLSETIKPLLENLVTKLNEFLVPETQELDFIDPTPEDVDLAIKRIESGSKNFYLTLNEQRELAGYEPMVDGDVILAPFNLSPLDTTVTEEPEPTPTETPKGVRVKKKEFKHPLKDKEFRRKYFDVWVGKAIRRENAMLKKIRSIFKAQRERLVSALDNQQIKQKNLIDDVFNIKLEIQLSVSAIIPLMTRFYEESGEDAFQLFNVDKPFRLNASDEVKIEKRAELFAKEISATTVKKLQKEFEQSLADGENRNQLVKRIEGVYGDISKGRAMNIARTETLVASQSGLFSGYEKAGVPIKIWVAVLDDVTRESHADIDGEEQLLGDNFSNGLAFPGDPSGPADEVINCRCTI